MARRPNILLITSHDIGRHLGCYGVGTVHTENLDRLSQTGVRFDKAFCTAPTCSPSRASIFTGRYPNSTGVLGLCHGGFAWDLNDDEVHLAQYLRQAGYETELFGVMHETARFDRWGYNRLVVLTDDHRTDCQTITNQAVERLEAMKGSDRPWFFHLGYFEPHHPFDFGGARPDDSMGVTVPTYLVDEPSAREEFARFQGAIRNLDAAVGQVLHRLQQLGMEEDTIVLFTADHGIPFPRAKTSLYDAGLGVALLLRWPKGGWAGGRGHAGLVSNVDILPTLLEAVGIAAPARVQGRSFAPLLDGRACATRNEAFAEQNYHGGGWFLDPRRAVRTERHKLIVNFTTNAPWQPYPGVRVCQALAEKVARMDQYGSYPLVELYDLGLDPLELNNLADSRDNAEISADLRSRLHQWMIDTGDPLLKGLPVPPTYGRAMRQLTPPWSAKYR